MGAGRGEAEQRILRKLWWCRPLAKTVSDLLHGKVVYRLRASVCATGSGRCGLCLSARSWCSAPARRNWRFNPLLRQRAVRLSSLTRVRQCRVLLLMCPCPRCGVIRAEPPVAIILGVLLVLAVLAIRPLLANLGETTARAPRPVPCGRRCCAAIVCWCHRGNRGVPPPAPWSCRGCYECTI